MDGLPLDNLEACCYSRSRVSFGMPSGYFRRESISMIFGWKLIGWLADVSNVYTVRNNGTTPSLLGSIWTDKYSCFHWY